MYGRPSAKLVPAANLDDLVTEGAGFAGFAAGEIGQLPSDPDIAAIPDLDELHARSVAAEPRALRLRRHRRGRAVAVLPAHDPAQPARPREGARLRVQARHRARVLPRPPPRGRLDRGLRPGRHAREALLRHGRPHPAVRLPHHRLEVLQRARLGQLRERPRGRERAVRAELRATTTRSSRCDRAIFFRYMVHTLAEQHGMVATFMPKPFTHLTGNGCHFHMSLWRDGENVFLDEADPRGLGLSTSGLQLRRRAEDARARVLARSPRRPSTRTSGSSSARPRAAPRGRRSGSRTATTTARRCSASRPPGGSRTARSTARRTRTSPRRRCSPPASTGSRRASTPASRTRTTSTRSRYDELTRPRPADAAGEPARGDRRARERRRPARRARQGPRRGLRRLLREGQARRVVPLPRAGHRVGDRAST